MHILDGPRVGPSAGGSPRQVVILCHGYGADGYDLIDLAPAWAKTLPHAAFAAPNAPFPCEMAPMGRQWFGLADRSPERLEAGVRAAAALLDAFIDAECERLGLPASACALMGFSQGAMTALFAGLRRRTAPRAILAYSGSLIARDRLASEIVSRPPRLHFAWRSRRGRAGLPLARRCRSAAFLRRRGRGDLPAASRPRHRRSGHRGWRRVPRALLRGRNNGVTSRLIPQVRRLRLAAASAITTASSGTYYLLRTEAPRLT